jgi:uncharacterized protein YjbI with pentapeptide repeats
MVFRPTTVDQLNTQVQNALKDPPSYPEGQPDKWVLSSITDWYSANSIPFSLEDLKNIGMTPSQMKLAWSQMGGDIDGEAASDYSGYSVSLSSDGTIMAIGAYGNDDNGDASGHVRVYQYTNGSWSQLGNDIDGEGVYDYSGYSVSLSSDGKIVAIGAYKNDGNGTDSGHVRVYEYTNDSWSQMGSDIDGEGPGDYSGRSVSLSSNGSIVAIGAYYNDGTNGSDSGHVRVFEYSGGTWNQMGTDIDGEAASDRSGRSVSLSGDGTIVAIGADGNDGNGSASGHVRVYEWNGTAWVKKGQDIDGEAALDYSGYSVSLSSDGSIVAIGAYWNDGNGIFSGHVRIYEYDGTAWVKKGQDIDGEAALDYSGYSVSLSSNGSIVAIGAYGNDGNGTNSGRVCVYQYDGGTWNQIGTDIDGEAPGDESGYSVSLSSDGSIVAIGARYNDGNGTSSGHVRVYDVSNGYSLAELKAGGFTAAELKAGGFTLGELKAGGFTAAELKADFTLAELKAANFTAAELKAANFTAAELKAANFTAAELKAGGFTAAELKADFTLAELKAANFTAAELKAANFTAAELKAANFTAAELKADFTLAELKAGGFTAAELKAGGFTAAELKAGGFTLAELKAGGFTTAELKAAFTAAELKAGGFTAAALKAGGFTLGELINASFPFTQLLDAGYSISVAQMESYWNPLGNDIDGEAADDKSGQSVSLSSNGKIVAIGANYNDGNTGNSNDNRGHVRVYQYTNGSWVQMGTDIDGEGVYDLSGWSVSLSSDGLTVAIGAYWNDGNTGDISDNRGHVRVYKYTNGSWTQMGTDIDGEAADDYSGTSVSLSSDGYTVAIGASNNDGNTGNTNDNRGHVRVYKYSGGTWNQLGGDIDGEAASDRSGTSVSLSSTGYTVAIGAYGNDGTNGSDSGHVRVFEYKEFAQSMVNQYHYSNQTQDSTQTLPLIITSKDDNGNYIAPIVGQSYWTQLGQDIDGEASGDLSGISVSLSSNGSSNGTIVAIGANWNDGTNGSYSGHVRVYQYITNTDTNTSSWVQMGTDIDGEAANDQSGRSVSLSSDGTIMAIGTYKNDGNGTDSGHVRVYQYITNTDTNTSSWTQLSGDIDGEAALDFSGRSVSLSSDGYTVAIGADGNDANGNVSGHVRVYQYYGTPPLKTLGYTATDLATVGFNASQLKNLGYSSEQLNASIFDVAQQKSGGYTLTDLKDGGINAAELHKVGYSFDQLRVAGFSAVDCRNANMSNSEIVASGFSIIQLLEGGFSAKRMKNAGYNARELYENGYPVPDLFEADYSASEIRQAGVNALQARFGGIKNSQLKTAGYTVEEYKAASYKASRMKEAGYTRAELEGVYSKEELDAVGL